MIDYDDTKEHLDKDININLHPCLASGSGS